VVLHIFKDVFCGLSKEIAAPQKVDTERWKTDGK
jgi:hypothetical protein